MSRKEQMNNLHKSLMILSRKLNIEDYSLVAGTMFQLYTGYKFGYKQFDQQFLTDIHFIWKIHHKKSIQNKAKILKLKVVDGGKVNK
jgi:hypothetical protein